MYENSPNSQQLFRELELNLRQVTLEQFGDFSGSFNAFCCWLNHDRPDVVLAANKIALDIRLWRDTQDVLRQLWEQLYKH